MYFYESQFTMLRKISLLLVAFIVLFISIIVLKLAFLGKNVNIEECKPYLLTSQHNKNIKLSFLGTSCFVIEYKGRQFMSDPFFSNPNIPSVIKGDMKHVALNSLMNDSLFSNVSMTTISHGHYDHCFDIQQILKPATTIVADSSIFNQMNFLTKNRLHSFPLDFTPHTKWIYSYDSSFRVFPVLSKHGPHFGKTVLFNGSYEKPIDELPNKLWEWKLGKGNYSYLVDVLDNDSIVFRMALLYGDISESEYAKIKSIYSEQKCDIVTCVFWKKKQNEPQLKIAIENTGASMVLLNHWNNFFKGHDKPLQQLRSSKLEKELKEFREENIPAFIMLPYSTVDL